MKETTKFDLSHKAARVYLTFRKWNPEARDDAAAGEVLSSKQATRGSGKFTKKLIGDDLRKAITKTETFVRTAHYDMTLPWSDDGWRLITTAAFADYVKMIDEGRRMLNDAIAPLLNSWPSIVEQQKTRLGKLFSEDDYPPVNVLRSKYAIDYRIEPIVTAGDFRCNLAQADVDAIKQSMEERMKENMREAQMAVWSQLNDSLSRFLERMDSGGAFRDSLVGNLRDLCTMIPKLNVFGDKELDAVADAVMTNIASLEPDMLRPAKTEGAEVFMQMAGAEARRLLEIINNRTRR